MIDMGEFIMHPRNSSIVHDLSDPITVHINTAEAVVRRGIRCHQNLPVISELVEFNYIENKTLEKQFLVSPQSVNMLRMTAYAVETRDRI